MTFAMVECSDGSWRPAMGGKRFLDDGLVWVFPDGSLRDQDKSTSRPLVALDPEDREAVERLYGAIFSAYRETHVDPVEDHDVECMRQALREFANPKPPKPEEPMGAGAIVKDADGVRWVNWRDPGCVTHDRPWQRLQMDTDEFRNYGEIAVVTVLFEGDLVE